MRAAASAAVLALAVFAAQAGGAGLGGFSYSARLDLESRIRGALAESPATSSVTGVVTVAGDDFFFVQDGDSALKVVLGRAAPRPPSPGDLVEVSGRPTLEGGRVVMTSESFGRIGSAELPKPRAADMPDLVFAGGGPGDRARDVNWRRVEVKGRAMGVTENGFSLEVSDGLLISVTIPSLPSFVDGCDRLHPLVAVRGVAELFLDQSALFGGVRYVIGVRLCASSADDVSLLPDLAYQMRLHERKVSIALWSAVGLLLAGLFALSALVLRHRKIRYSTAVVMAERKRMADDLHDTIEQHLAGAGMLLQLAQLPANGLPASARRPLREAQDILLRAKREMRDVVWGLKNDDMMRQSPAEMLQSLAASLSKPGMVRMRMRLDGLPERLEAGAMRDLSLIVREAVANAVKHGRARKVAITADPVGGPGGWELRIANDGEPFDAAAAPGPAEGHFGLEGMKERARRIGAELAISRRGGWTVVSVRVGG